MVIEITNGSGNTISDSSEVIELLDNKDDFEDIPGATRREWAEIQ